MKKLVIGLALAVLVYQLALRGGFLSHDASATPPAASASASASDAIARAYEQQRSGVQVESEGVVEKVLKDDNDGSRHQRFIVRVPSGQTILIAHNIDLAPRVDSLREGDRISFSGEYEWNDKGGAVHWTHRDPSGRHVAGWLRHDGHVYQ